MSISPEPIRVKITIKYGAENVGEGWNALCPGRQPAWGRCRFIFDPADNDYDWLVVIHDLPKTRGGAPFLLTCPAENTLFVTTEPASITKYGRNFVRQFAHVLTSQEAKDLPHPNAIRSQTGNIWFYGKNHDEAAAMTPCEKTNLFSTVCSSKRQGHTLHAKRYAFTQRLKSAIPEMDIFGHGVRFIEHKYDALDPYAFHLAIENHYAPHHWTEKLADAFLGYTVPIYYGCPNVSDYFPEESVIPIDIHDFDGAVSIIREALTFENYQRRLPAILEARRRVMEHYTFPALISNLIAGVHDRQPAPALAGQQPTPLYGRRQMRIRHPLDFADFAWWRISNYAQCLWHNGGKRE